MKSKSHLIDDVLNNLVLNESEALELVKKLIEKYKFTSEVCFPVVKKRGRPKGSLNKKTIAKLKEQKLSEKKEVKKKTAEKKLSSPVPKTEVKKKTPIKKKTAVIIHKFDPNVILEKITGFEMGKEYPFYILYKGDDGYIRSNRILENWNAEGVIIPYKTIGRQFVIGMNDECADFTLRQAEEYAQTIPTIKGNHWEVMTAEQIGVVKSFEEELNGLLKKIGGDLFVGSYVQDPKSNGKKGKLKIRYAVDI